MDGAPLPRCSRRPRARTRRSPRGCRTRRSALAVPRDCVDRREPSQHGQHRRNLGGRPTSSHRRACIWRPGGLCCLHLGLGGRPAGRQRGLCVAVAALTARLTLLCKSWSSCLLQMIVVSEPKVNEEKSSGGAWPPAPRRRRRCCSPNWDTLRATVYGKECPAAHGRRVPPPTPQPHHGRRREQLRRSPRHRLPARPDPRAPGVLRPDREGRGARGLQQPAARRWHRVRRAVQALRRDGALHRQLRPGLPALRRGPPQGPRRAWRLVPHGAAAGHGARRVCLGVERARGGRRREVVL